MLSSHDGQMHFQYLALLLAAEDFILDLLLS